MNFLSFEGLSRYTEKLKAYIDSKLGQQPTPSPISTHKVGEIFLSATQTETDEILECNGRSISCSSYPEYLNSVGFKFGQSGAFWRGSYSSGFDTNYMSAARYDGKRISLLGYSSNAIIMDMDYDDTTGSFNWYNSAYLTTDLSRAGTIFYCGSKLCYVEQAEYGVLNRSSNSYTRSRVGALSESLGQYSSNYYGILNNGENSVILVKYVGKEVSIFIFTLNESTLTVQQYLKVYTLPSDLSANLQGPIKLGNKIYMGVTYVKSVDIPNRIIGFDIEQGSLVDHIPEKVLSFFYSGDSSRNLYFKNKECTQYTAHSSRNKQYSIAILSTGQDDELELRCIDVDTNGIPIFYSSPASIEKYRDGFSAKRSSISNLYPFLLNDRLCVVGLSDNLAEYSTTASTKYVQKSVIGYENDSGGISYFGQSNLTSNSSTSYSMTMDCTQNNSQPFDGFFMKTTTSSSSTIRPIVIRPDWLEAGIPNSFESLDTTLKLVSTSSSQRVFPAASRMTFIKVKEET